MELVTAAPDEGLALEEASGSAEESLSVYLNAPGHPRKLLLHLPVGLSTTETATQWVLVRVPTQELLNRLARWSHPSFPNLKKLSSILAAIDAGKEIETPVLVEQNVGHVFESGGHLALMLAQLGAPSLPVVVRLATSPRPPRRRSLRAMLRRLMGIEMPSNRG